MNLTDRVASPVREHRGLLYTPKHWRRWSFQFRPLKKTLSAAHSHFIFRTNRTQESNFLGTRAELDSR
jgi:hypothetical protein